MNDTHTGLPRRQRGAVLVVSLIMLAVLTLFVISMIKTSVIELKMIETSCGRLGITNVERIIADSSVLETEPADKILVDAPCSGLGVLRKKPDIRWKREPEDMTRFVRLGNFRLRKYEESVVVTLKPLDGETPIVPIIVGETAAAIRMSEMLLDEGVFVTGFGFPVVPQGTARVRCQLSAAHTRDDLDVAVRAFRKVGTKLGLI